MTASDLEGKLQWIVDAIPIWIAYLDAEPRYRLVNAACRDALGDVRGLRMIDVVGAEPYELLRPHVERALSGAPVAFEVALPEVAGPRWWRARYTPHLVDGAVHGFVSQLEDVTPQRQLERELAVLAEATQTLAAPIDRAATLLAIASSPLPRLADWAVVYLERNPEPAALAPNPPAEVLRRTARAFAPEPAGIAADAAWAHPVARALRGFRAVQSAREALAPGLREALDDTNAVVAAAPLVARGRTSGALLVGRARARGSDARLPPEELALLEELGRRGGAALDTAERFDAELRTNARLGEAIARQRELDRKKDEFLAILGHELRNPLAPIVTAVDLMELGGAVGFQRERDVIRRQTQHLTRLVDDLLDVARVSREKIQLSKEPLELWTVIGRAIEVTSPLLEQRRHRLEVEIAHDGLLVDADALRLSQVFSNLLTNAAKYTDPGGRIAIRAARRGDEILVSVEDNGHGITEQLLGSIFEPFVQSNRTLDRAQGGLGLGLALVRSLTQLHGGTVVAYSDGPGRGSRFEVRLPALQAESVQVEAALAEGGEHVGGEGGARIDGAGAAIGAMFRTGGIAGAGPGAGSNGDAGFDGVRRGRGLSAARGRRVAQPAARVMVVDDNEDAADLLAHVLRRAGYEVAVAHDAPAALHLAARFGPAIALLDIGLPVMDGYELARHLRATLAQPPRLVAVSGYGHDADLARSRAAGFEVHLGKPVSFDTLVNVLGDLAAR